MSMLFFSLCIFLTTESFGKCFCFEAYILTVHSSIYCSLLLLHLLLLLTFTNVLVLLKCMVRILLTVTLQINTNHRYLYMHSPVALGFRQQERQRSHSDTHAHVHQLLHHLRRSWPHLHLCTCSFPKPRLL